MRGISEVRVGRAEISSKFVEGFTPDERTGRHVQHAVFGIEFIDRRAAATCVALAEDFLKVAMQQFVDTITHVSVITPKRMIPAWLTSTETGPKVSSAAATVAAQSASLVTSRRVKIA